MRAREEIVTNAAPDPTAHHSRPASVAEWSAAPTGRASPIGGSPSA
ncbi:hypothetical protein M1L60_27540 [Actinoplanes sp. TRM 88003]|uniref:Uncharacterized protein n=1 Tax=Paractinoplanes aksuensis TaxID=2939490 RepID=A0ABT1DU59_9ACTN|nr:hypothetical protein [Actinoplanes aksuensis]MCO8274358.1 hypothetical protein [Actinoplanes aksuensis]